MENAGEFVVPFDAMNSVRAQKIMLNREKRTPDLLKAIDHAHDDESRVIHHKPGALTLHRDRHISQARHIQYASHKSPAILRRP